MATSTIVLLVSAINSSYTEIPSDDLVARSDFHASMKEAFGEWIKRSALTKEEEARADAKRQEAKDKDKHALAALVNADVDAVLAWLKKEPSTTFSRSQIEIGLGRPLSNAVFSALDGKVRVDGKRRGMKYGSMPPAAKDVPVEHLPERQSQAKTG